MRVHNVRNQFVLWSAAEDAYVREHTYIDMTPHEISVALNRPLGSLRLRMAKMGIRAPGRLQQRRWLPEEDDFIHAHYASMDIDVVAAHLNRTHDQVVKRAHAIGVTSHGYVKREPEWTNDELLVLWAHYCVLSSDGLRVECDADFAKRLGRTLNGVQIKAGRLGFLGDGARAETRITESEHLHRSQVAKDRLRKHGHPRGALGLVHTPEARQRMSIASKRTWELWKQTGTGHMSPEALQSTSDRLHQRALREGCPTRSYSRGLAGVRSDVGPMRFRSAWEANIGRLLNEWMLRGYIVRWEYEPDTFVFYGERRGVRSYRPDFKVWDSEDAEPHYWEVKGWDMPKAKRARVLMATYYPSVILRLIDKPVYDVLEKEYRHVMPDWEVSRNKEDVA